MKDNFRELESLLTQAKVLAKEYRRLTGKPLGITGEVAEVTAARLLGLRLAGARQPGYDAIRESNGREEKLQIKGRLLTDRSKPGQRLSRITADHDWDAVALVLLDMDYEPVEIREANRGTVLKALSAPGSRARNERGQLSVSKFRAISKIVWQAGG